MVRKPGCQVGILVTLHHRGAGSSSSLRDQESSRSSPFISPAPTLLHSGGMSASYIIHTWFISFEMELLLALYPALPHSAESIQLSEVHQPATFIRNMHCSQYCAGVLSGKFLTLVIVLMLMSSETPPDVYFRSGNHRKLLCISTWPLLTQRCIMILLLMLVILCNAHLYTFLCFGKQIVTWCTAMHRHKLAMLAAAKADTNATTLL